MNQFTSVNSIRRAMLPSAGVAGQTTINSDIIDVSDASGVAFIVQMGAITNGGVQSLKLVHGDTANLSDATDVAGSNQTIAVADAEKVFYVDVAKPTKRYVRLVVSRSVQNSAVEAILAVLYGVKSQAPAQGANVLGEAFVAPVSGTA